MECWDIFWIKFALGGILSVLIMILRELRKQPINHTDSNQLKENMR